MSDQLARIGHRLSGEVMASELLDHLIIVPRRGVDPHELVSAVRELVPGMRLRRVAGGIAVPGEQAEALLGVSGSVDLHWRAEARRFAENRKWAKKLLPHLRGQVDRLRLKGREAADPLVSGLDGIEVLDDHQVVNVAAMTLPDSYGLCLFDEQGAGKTVTVIFAFDLLVARDLADIALIVAPKSMVAEWPHDISRFKGDLYRTVMVVGSTREKLAALGTQADIYITNFETAVSMEAELRALLRRHSGRGVLVVDESFFVKNLDAKRTRALRRIREWCYRAYVLCGTPAPNSPLDLVQQFSLMDFGQTFDCVQVPEDRAAAAPVVQHAIEERGLFMRHLKSEVLPGLPGKSFHRILMPLQPQQDSLYRQALGSYVLDLRSTDDLTFKRTLTSFMARRMALLQLCSNPAGIVPGYTEAPSKLVALDTLFEELIGRRGEKVVIWSFFTASLEAILRRFARYRPVRYDGHVAGIEERRDAVRRFQEDGETMLFVGNPAAAGAGLTLHRARIAVYESMSNQAAHYLQSLDRIHRRGQEREVEYLVLLCERTLEVQEYTTLLDKESAARSLLRDRDQEPPTRESFLREAENAAELLGL